MAETEATRPDHAEKSTSDVWVKSRPGVPQGFFATEAAGLRWLADAQAIRVVEVRGVHDTQLQLERLESVRPTAQLAYDCGVQLARLHASGADAFGVLPPGASSYFFGPLSAPMELPTLRSDSFAEFYVSARLEPLVRGCRDAGVLSDALLHLLQDVMRKLDGYARQVRPARVHGDLWSGNLMWTSVGATLIDPAACGNHPFADLAMLRMFGAPYLEELERGYAEQAGLDAGWRDEICLHQLFGLLAHLALFGTSYAADVEQAARASLHLVG